MKEKRLLSRILGMVMMIGWLFSGCSSDNRDSVQSTTVSCWQLVPQGNVPVSISYPTTVKSGNSTYIGISISNDSDIAWNGVRVMFDSSMVPTGDNYFTGFALDDSEPLPTESWVRSDGVLAQVKWNSTAVPQGEEVSFHLGLRAVKPGGYGTQITVIVDQADDNCYVDQIIYTTIKE